MNSGYPVHRLRTLWTVLGRTGRIAAVVGAVAGIVVAVSLWSLLGALFTSAATSDARIVQDQKQQADRFAKGFEGYLSQINGRSLFFAPSPPPRRDARLASDDNAPKAPARYGGPALIGFANDAAYFADGRMLRVGDDSDPTLKIKKVEPPWGAVVVWEGAEFSISLFDRDRLVFPTAGAPSEPPKPDETRTDASAPGAPNTPPPAETKAGTPVRAADPAPSSTPARPSEASPKTDSPSVTTVPAGTAGE